MDKTLPLERQLPILGYSTRESREKAPITLVGGELELH